jgi:hypothetical protein
MRRVALIVLLSITAASAADKDRERFAPGPASSYPHHQTLEKVTIAAIPYTSEEQAASAFGKARPYKYGILPVLVVIQNDTGKSLRLNLEAEYIRPDNRHVESIPASDVYLYDGAGNRSWKSGVPRSTPLPLPHRKKKGPLASEEIEGRAFNVHLLPPGDSAHGFFYFETDSLAGARLYLNGIKDASTGKDYFYFEVPLEQEPK